MTRTRASARAAGVDKVLTRVHVSSAGCWEYQGARLASGYGSVRLGQQSTVTHRVVWEGLVGPISAGLQLDHLCRNRACCNPDHLEPVTQRVNLIRGAGFAGVNYRKTECSHGHAYTADNTYTRPSDGSRDCRACRAKRRRKAYLRERHHVA